MNKKEIEKMISLADDSYIEEMFTTRLYERKRHGAAWIAAVAAAAAIAVGAAGIAMNSAESDKFVADLQDIITETETDTSVLETSVTTVFRSFLADRRGYFKNEPDDTMEYYYHLLERDLDFTSDGPVYRFSQEYLEEITRFTPEYRESEFRFERKDFRFLEGGLQCDKSGEPLYANIRLYNDDTENLPMVHMVFYSDESNFAGFDKSLYTSHMYGDIELYGFDFSEEKDGSKLMACWRSGDTNYMFVSRDLGVDNFLAVVGEYYEFLRKGENGLMYVEDDFTLDSFDLNSGAVRAVSYSKGASEMNSRSVFAGFIPDYSPLAGLIMYDDPQDQNYVEVNIGEDIVYRRYRQLFVDLESYEIGNGSEKIYISLIYEWGEEPDSDTVSHAPIVSLEEITPEKLDEIRTDEWNKDYYSFVIPMNDFTITVRASCERERLLEAMDALRAQGESVTRLSLDEANADTPFAGYIPRSDSIEGLDLTGVIKDTSERDELRVMYRGENKLRETEYVHLYYSTDGYMPKRQVDTPEGEKMLPPVQVTPETLSAERLDGIKKLGSGDLTKHSFYLNVNESEFYIRVEALCSSEKLMKFFEDMPDFKAQTADEITEPADSGNDTVMYNGRKYYRSELSEETLKWLDRYNSLPEEERLATSFVPEELRGSPDEISSQTAVITTEPVDSGSDTVMYEGRKYYRSMLSEETLEWLDWYNSLPEEEQLAVSYEPEELSYLQYKF